MLLYAEKNDFIWLLGSNPGIMQRTNGTQWQTCTTSGMCVTLPIVMAITTNLQGNVYVACCNNTPSVMLIMN